MTGMDFMLRRAGQQERRLSDTIQAYYPLHQSRAYTIVNAQIGVAGDNWEFTVNAENLTDKDYYTDCAELPELLRARRGRCLRLSRRRCDCLTIGTLGQPRLITASLSYFF